MWPMMLVASGVMFMAASIYLAVVDEIVASVIALASGILSLSIGADSAVRC